MTTQSVTEPLAPAPTDREQMSKHVAASRSPSAAPSQAAGMAWFAGWLFTIGYAKLVWWKAVFGILVWPYFLGETIH